MSSSALTNSDGERLEPKQAGNTEQKAAALYGANKDKESVWTQFKRFIPVFSLATVR